MILEISERCRSWLDEPTLMWDVQGPGVSFIVVHAGFCASRGREFQDCSLLVGFGEFFLNILYYKFRFLVYSSD